MTAEVGMPRERALPGPCSGPNLDLDVADIAQSDGKQLLLSACRRHITAEVGRLQVRDLPDYFLGLDFARSNGFSGGT